MASLSSRSQRRRCVDAALQIRLEAARTTFRLSPWQRNHKRRLQGILSRSVSGWRLGQYRQNGISLIESLPFPQVRQGQYNNMVAASVSPTRQLANKRTSALDILASRDTAYRAFYNTGDKYRGQSGRDMRVIMGSGRLRQRNAQLYATWTNKDKQEPRRSANEHQRQISARESLQGPIERLCDRVSGQTSEICQKGFRAAFGTNWHTLLCARFQTYLRSVDGAGRYTNAKNSSISWTHHNCGYRAGLRQIFAVVYEGCQRRRFLVASTSVHGAVFRNGGIMVLLGRIELPTSSLPMVSPNAKLRFSGLFASLFGQYSTFLVAYGMFPCTHSTCRAETGLQSHSSPYQTQRICG